MHLILYQFVFVLFINTYLTLHAFETTTLTALLKIDLLLAYLKHQSKETKVLSGDYTIAIYFYIVV